MSGKRHVANWLGARFTVRRAAFATHRQEEADHRQAVCASRGVARRHREVGPQRQTDVTACRPSINGQRSDFGLP